MGQSSSAVWANLTSAPTAQAVNSKLDLIEPTSFESSNGIGVRGELSGQRIVLGNTALMDEEKVAWKALSAQAEALRSEGASVMYLAADRRLVGLIAVADPVRPNTLEALDALRAEGLTVIMATGDGLTTARRWPPGAASLRYSVKSSREISCSLSSGRRSKAG